jgi:branched-chain amino acid transport system ATP-binding protein
MLDIDSVHTYYGDSHVLNGISLSVDESEIVALLGRNGAGKTTTLRSIMGHQPPRQGRIELNGEQINGLTPEKIFGKGVGFIPEDRGIFPDLTVRENLRVGLQSGDDADEAFEQVYEYFPRLEERTNQKGGTLSGGEQQMLAIGRVIASDQSLLLIDEPTEGLMPTLVEDLKDIILKLNEDGHTVLLVEQNSEMALEISDRAYIIEKGEIKLDGASDELMEREDVLKDYLAL